VCVLVGVLGCNDSIARADFASTAGLGPIVVFAVGKLPARDGVHAWFTNTLRVLADHHDKAHAGLTFRLRQGKCIGEVVAVLCMRVVVRIGPVDFEC